MPTFTLELFRLNDWKDGRGFYIAFFGFGYGEWKYEHMYFGHHLFGAIIRTSFSEFEDKAIVRANFLFDTLYVRWYGGFKFKVSWMGF